MTEYQAQAGSHELAENQQSPVANPQKKKAGWSWLRTILWMLSMMLLVNAVMGIVAYFLFFYKK